MEYVHKEEMPLLEYPHARFWKMRDYFYNFASSYSFFLCLHFSRLNLSPADERKEKFSRLKCQEAFSYTLPSTPTPVSHTIFKHVIFNIYLFVNRRWVVGRGRPLRCHRQRDRQVLPRPGAVRPGGDAGHAQLHRVRDIQISNFEFFRVLNNFQLFWWEVGCFCFFSDKLQDVACTEWGTFRYDFLIFLWAVGCFAISRLLLTRKDVCHPR